jgi:DNA-binding MarR family transcriptional regulator
MKELYEDIRTVHLLMEGSVARALSAVDLTSPGYNALAVLAETGALPITQLARRLLIDDSTATRVVDALERQDLVRRVADPVDRRIRRVEMTHAGRERLRAAGARVDDVAVRFFAPLGADVQAQLATAMRQLLKANSGGTDE